MRRGSPAEAKMPSLSIAEIADRFPDFRVALVVAEDLRIGAARSAALASRDRRDRGGVPRALGGTELSAIPGVAAWRAAYKGFGIKRTSYRSSVERLIKRVLAGGALPRGQRAGRSLQRGLAGQRDSASAATISTRSKAISPSAFRAPATAFIDMGAEEGEDPNDPPKVGEVVYADARHVLCRRWNWRQDARSAVSAADPPRRADRAVERLRRRRGGRAGRLVARIARECGGRLPRRRRGPRDVRASRSEPCRVRLRNVKLDINISLCLIRARLAARRPLSFDALLDAPRGGGRGDAAAAARPALRGRADGQRARRHPRPVAAARLAPSEAAGRRRASPSASARAPGRSSGSPITAARWRATSSPASRPTIRRCAADRARLAVDARGAAQAGGGLFRRARRRLGPHPRAARAGGAGRGGDPRDGRRRADPRAARSRHRHRAHARTARAARRPRRRRRPEPGDAGARARAHRRRAACATSSCARATSTRRRSSATPTISSSSIRCCISSTIPPARCARRRGRCGPAGGCWSSISPRTARNSCASNSPIAGSASPTRRSPASSTEAGLAEVADRAASRRPPASPASSPSRSGSRAIRAIIADDLRNAAMEFA